jgi:hypothetical protein
VVLPITALHFVLSSYYSVSVSSAPCIMISEQFYGAYDDSIRRYSQVVQNGWVFV